MKDIKKNIESIYPLSPMQKGLLFESLYNKEANAYFVQKSFTLKGNVQVDKLKKVFEIILAAYPVLRTMFVWENVKEPVQIVLKQIDLPWQYLDLSDLEENLKEKEIRQFLSGDFEKGFNLGKAPLIRFAVLKLDEGRYTLIWSHHHIILDGWSLSIISSDIMRHYKALVEGSAPEITEAKPYRDFIAWLKQQDAGEARAFWKRDLEGFSAPTPLLTASSREVSSYAREEFDKEYFSLSPELTVKVNELCRMNKITLNTLINGVWAYILYHYSHEDDVIFGSVVSGRPPEIAGIEEMVGLFINTIPSRIAVDESLSLLNWLKEIQRQQAERNQYSYMPLYEIKGLSDISHEEPVFNSTVIIGNYVEEDVEQKYDELLSIDDDDNFEAVSHPLVFGVNPGKTMDMELYYNSAVFDPGVIKLVSRKIIQFLEIFTRETNILLSNLSLMTEEEKTYLTYTLNDTAFDYKQESYILHHLFERQVEKNPGRVAVQFGNRSLTYRELNNRANQLARYLVKQGVGIESFVGVCMERSLEMVIALYGIIKAGGAYVPMDPDYPAARLEFMFKDSEISLLLTQEKFLSEILPDLPVLALDSMEKELAEESCENPDLALIPSNLAYMIYTSGSTGTPKGVMNTHEAICNRLLWMQKEYQLMEDDRILQKTPFSFDVSVWEFFWPLLSGARLVVAAPGGHQDPGYLKEIIGKERITTVHFVPSMLNIFLEEPGVGEAVSLKRVICSGEALSFSSQQKFYETFSGAGLYNLYGPTEAAIDVTYWTCPRDSSYAVVPIGKAIDNIYLYVLDEKERLVPEGASGELHIGGIGLARGYWNREDLTAQKFIKDPVRRDGKILYKTGDLVRYLGGGNIEFLGRMDYQVKIRGFRIELGEIEARLREHPSIKDVVVIDRADKKGNKNLVAYVVPAAADFSVEELRSFLEDKLPAYMVPAFFVSLDSIPLSHNGKVNRKALPEIDGSSIKLSHPYTPPENEIQEELVTIWQDILGHERIGIYDNFFELGGHSIKLIQLIARIRAAFGVELSLGEIFEIPDIAELSNEIVEKILSEESEEDPAGIMA